MGKIIISKELQNEIDYLHSVVGNNEWSGMLVYETVTKDISAMENLVFIGKHIFLMDIGKAASTEFTYNKDIVDMYDAIPDIDNIGMIHTHHSMGAFLSATDITDLMSNASSYNYYLSLVVAFSKKYVCKIAFPTNTSTSTDVEMTGYNGNTFMRRIESTEKSVLISPLTVEFEQPAVMDEWFVKRYDTLKAVKEAEEKKVATKSWEKSTVPTNMPCRTLWDDMPDDTVKDKQFVASILYGWEVEQDEIGAYDLEEIIDCFAPTDALDFSWQNVQIIHDNIYGTASWSSESKHVKMVIDELIKFKKNHPDIEKDRKDALTLMITQLSKYNKTYGNYYY